MKGTLERPDRMGNLGSRDYSDKPECTDNKDNTEYKADPDYKDNMADSDKPAVPGQPAHTDMDRLDMDYTDTPALSASASVSYPVLFHKGECLFHPEASGIHIPVLQDKAGESDRFGRFQAVLRQKPIHSGHEEWKKSAEFQIIRQQLREV